MVLSSPAISNTQGKQRLVQYDEGSLNSEHLLRQIKSTGNVAQFDIARIRYIPCSIWPNSTACMRFVCVCGRVGKKSSFQAFFIVHSFALACLDMLWLI